MPKCLVNDVPDAEKLSQLLRVKRRQLSEESLQALQVWKWLILAEVPNFKLETPAKTSFT